MRQSATPGGASLMLSASATASACRAMPLSSSGPVAVNGLTSDVPQEAHLQALRHMRQLGEQRAGCHIHLRRPTGQRLGLCLGGAAGIWELEKPLQDVIQAAGKPRPQAGS